MDERCRQHHAKLLSGTCPWCGGTIINGQVTGVATASNLRETVLTVGNSLRAMVEQNGRLEYRSAAAYLRAVAEFLASFHDAGGVHRSISPDVVFVDDANVVTMVRDGIGGVAGATADVGVDERAILRSADCLAPEQVLNSHAADPRSDIYSLGCVLYFLLTGQPPFPDGSISERLLKHQTATPTPINELRSDVPLELAQICAKMLAKKPADRYQTAAEVAAALANIK